MPRFDAFLGVDQTGAAVAGGAAARPLPCVWLDRSGRRGAWRLRSRDPRNGRALWLPALDAAHVATLAAALGSAGPLAMMVDCVIGLPAPVGRALRLRGRGAAPVWSLFRRAAADPAVPRYGRVASEAFFAALAAQARVNPSALPRRECELACNANSVFLTRPFQKNVQTGTHRIWRDLGAAGPAWAHVWPFEPIATDTPATPATPATPNTPVAPDTPDARGPLGTRNVPETRPWLFESFPSLFWRQLFGLRTRTRPELPAAVARAFRGTARVEVDDWDFIVADPERADAAVLALGGLLLQLADRLIEPFPGFTAHVRGLGLEGWIAGLDRAPLSAGGAAR